MEETLSSPLSVASLARQHGVNANQAFYRRKLYLARQLGCFEVDEQARSVRLLSASFEVDPNWSERVHFRLCFSAVLRSCSSINSSIRLALYLRVPLPNRITGSRGYLREEWSQTQSLLTFSLCATSSTVRMGSFSNCVSKNDFLAFSSSDIHRCWRVHTSGNNLLAHPSRQKQNLATHNDYSVHYSTPGQADQ